MEWQPIETVPKNGQFYLATNGKDYMVLNQPKGHAQGRWYKHRNGQWYGSSESYFVPTHWMPLPDPPKPED